MRSSILAFSRSAVLVALGWLAAGSADLPAQSSPRKGDGGKAPSTSSAPKKPAAPSASKPGPASTSAAPAAAGAAAGADAPPAEAGKRRTLVGKLRDFIVDHKFTVLGVLAAGVLLPMLLLFLLSRREQSSIKEAETAELIAAPAPRRSEEDEGPRRVLIDPATGKPKELPKRDDSEYALVVDEEELHSSAHGDDKAASGEFEKCALRVQEFIRQGEFDSAYKEYHRRIEKNKRSAFNPALERRMAKHFLKAKDIDKAVRILEHHIDTQPANEIEPETYFDLGYLHFKQKTIDKSRHYFKIFAEKERNPARSDRARKLLSDLEKMKSID
jgi:TolA-binding protein